MWRLRGTYSACVTGSLLRLVLVGVSVRVADPDRGIPTAAILENRHRVASIAPEPAFNLRPAACSLARGSRGRRAGSGGKCRRSAGCVPGRACSARRAAPAGGGVVLVLLAADRSHPARVLQPGGAAQCREPSGRLARSVPAVGGGCRTRSYDRATVGATAARHRSVTGSWRDPSRSTPLAAPSAVRRACVCAGSSRRDRPRLGPSADRDVDRRAREGGVEHRPGRDPGGLTHTMPISTGEAPGVPVPLPARDLPGKLAAPSWFESDGIASRALFSGGREGELERRDDQPGSSAELLSGREAGNTPFEVSQPQGRGPTSPGGSRASPSGPPVGRAGNPAAAMSGTRCRSVPRKATVRTGWRCPNG